MTGTNLLPAGVTDMINQLAADLPVTILALVAVLVPAGIALWAIGFGVKKGVGYLQKRGNKAV